VAVSPGDETHTLSPVAQKHLVLILARELASNLATPAALSDHEGRLVFFNEAAEGLVGHSFAETGEMPMDDWVSQFAPRTQGGRPLRIEERPAGVALRERRPVHGRFWVTSVDGIERSVSVTALPLFAHADEFVGVMTIFWRDADG
jgi:PAS domain-containing protein